MLIDFSGFQTYIIDRNVKGYKQCIAFSHVKSSINRLSNEKAGKELELFVIGAGDQKCRQPNLKAPLPFKSRVRILDFSVVADLRVYRWVSVYLIGDRSLFNTCQSRISSRSRSQLLGLDAQHEGT